MKGVAGSYMRAPVGYHGAQLLSQSGTPCVVTGTGLLCGCLKERGAASFVAEFFGLMSGADKLSCEKGRGDIMPEREGEGDFMPARKGEGEIMVILCHVEKCKCCFL